MTHEGPAEQLPIQEGDPEYPEMRRQAIQLAGEFIGAAMGWVYQGGTAKKSGVVIRSLALVYMTNPELFGSQAQLAAALGVSRKVVNTAVASFRDVFRYQLPSMRKTETRQKLSTLKTEFHATRAKAH